MGFNLDIIEQIGLWCDDATHLNLCLADKAYYETQKNYLQQRYDNSVVFETKLLINKCEHARGGITRLKLVHQTYRFLIGKHIGFLKRHRQMVDVMLFKLDEYLIGETSSNGLRMGVAPYRKYRKALLAL